MIIINSDGGNVEICNNKKIKNQHNAESIVRVTVGRILLQEMEFNEGSTLSFKVKKNAIIEICTRDRGLLIHDYY